MCRLLVDRSYGNTTLSNHDRPRRLPRQAVPARAPLSCRDLLELLSSGMTIDEISADYEDLERDDLLAVLAFAAELDALVRHPVPDRE